MTLPSSADPGPNYRVHREPQPPDPKRVFNAPGIVIFIAGLNLLVFGLMVLVPGRAVQIIEISAAVSPGRFMQGISANGGFLRWVSPLISHMFVHAGLLHLVFNLLWLLAFGTPIARRMGADRALRSPGAFGGASMFLTFYLLTGVAGALTFIAVHQNEYTLLVGASGGVSGLLGGLVRFAFNRSTMFGPSAAKISPLLSSSVITWSVMIIIMNIAVGFFGDVLAGGANVAWEAHLGGYFFGLLAYPFFEKAARAYR